SAFGDLDAADAAALEAGRLELSLFGDNESVFVSAFADVTLGAAADQTQNALVVQTRLFGEGGTVDTSAFGDLDAAAQAALGQSLNVNLFGDNAEVDVAAFADVTVHGDHDSVIQRQLFGDGGTIDQSAFGDLDANALSAF